MSSDKTATTPVINEIKCEGWCEPIFQQIEHTYYPTNRSATDSFVNIVDQQPPINNQTPIQQLQTKLTLINENFQNLACWVLSQTHCDTDLFVRRELLLVLDNLESAYMHMRKVADLQYRLNIKKDNEKDHEKDHEKEH